VWTQDEHAKARGLDYIRPFPQKAYLETIARIWAREPRLRIEKSRQLLITWLMASLHLHMALVSPGQRIAYQSKKFEDADAYLRDRFWFIYLHIPPAFAVPRARYTRGAIEVFHEDSALPTSQIVAMAQGPEQLRQFTFSARLSDENAFQERQSEAHSAAKPTLDGGGKDTIVSSANGKNFFYQLGHEDISL
jgi:phage FluMu gp28-like protein